MMFTAKSQRNIGDRRERRQIRQKYEAFAQLDSMLKNRRDNHRHNVNNITTRQQLVTMSYNPCTLLHGWCRAQAQREAKGMPPSSDTPGGAPSLPVPKVVVPSPATVLKFGMKQKVRRGGTRIRIS